MSECLICAGIPPSSEAQLAREVAAPFLKSPPASVEPIERPGAVNHVFRVYGPPSSVIVRVGRKEERTVEESLRDYRKEQWCMEQAHRHGIPVPQILAIGQHHGLAYMVQRFIEGRASDRLGSHPQDLYRQLGRFARLIHSIPLDGVGRKLLDSGHLLERPDDLLEQVHYNLGELGPDDPLVRLGVYEASSATKIARTLESLLTIPFRFGLCHNDFSPRNVIVAESGRLHLLDWGCACVAAIPHHDLHEIIIDMMEIGMEDESCLWAFAEGCGLDQSDFARLLKETNAYLLLKSLDVVRWAIDRKPDRIDSLVSARDASGKGEEQTHEHSFHRDLPRVQEHGGH